MRTRCIPPPRHPFQFLPHRLTCSVGHATRIGDTWSGSEDWSTATTQLEVETTGYTDSVSDVVIDSRLCNSLTRIELLYLSSNGWYAKDINLDCGGVLYQVWGPTCVYDDTFFDLASSSGYDWLRTYELVSRAELSMCFLESLIISCPRPHSRRNRCNRWISLSLDHSHPSP